MAMAKIKVTIFLLFLFFLTACQLVWGYFMQREVRELCTLYIYIHIFGVLS